jgi:hypothetical protein
MIVNNCTPQVVLTFTMREKDVLPKLLFSGVVQVNTTCNEQINEGLPGALEEE